MNVVDHFAQSVTYTSTYVGIAVALFATSCGVPIPEEIILVLAGAAAYHGAMEIWTLLAVALAAVIVSDFWVYGLGRFWGPKLLKWRFFQILFPPAKIGEARHRYQDHLLRTVFVVRFLSGLRTATYFTAGTLHVPAYKFVLTDLVAGLIHVPVFVLIGYLFSPKVAQIVSYIKEADRWVGVTVILAAVLLAALVGYHVGLRRKRAS